jgi:hypothetical protein
MAEIIDYERFAERLAQERPRLELLDEVQREWGYEDPGGEPLVTREGEAPGYQPNESDPIPAALVEWWDSPVNSFAFRPRLYWTHSQWPPSAPDTVEDPPDDEICVAVRDHRPGRCGAAARPGPALADPQAAAAARRHRLGLPLGGARPRPRDPRS